MICDCGHEVNVPASGPSGYSVTPDDRKICYPCAEKAEKAVFLTASKYSAYVSRKGNDFLITTWTGGVLAKISRIRKTDRRGAYSPWLYSIRALDENGGQWVGIGGGEGLYINLRRIKSKRG